MPAMNDDSIFLIHRVDCIAGKPPLIQTTCNPLKKLDFVGADRAAFRLSAKRPVHPTQMQWLKYCIRGQVRSHGPVFAARQRYVEDVVAPSTEK
ncbi:hypothetical protein [Pseudomonas viridiflava]|uniref:hypothetical protein n=2 Tax=Pseudomonas viridiflava TaxID=33069 RepID=UPI0013CE777B